MSESPKLLVDTPAEGIARFRVNRPEKRNAIDYDVRELMTEAFRSAIADGSGARAIVLGGVGGHFSAGGDIPSMVGLSEEQARERMQHIAVLCKLVADAPIPVITAMEGVSAGACVGLALLGDHIVVGQATKILIPFFKLGLVPDWGSLLTLPRRIGRREALRIMTAGKPISGEEAYRIGLADDFTNDDQVMDSAVSQAQMMSRLPQAAFARMKQRLNRPSSALGEELQREEDDQAFLLRSLDFAEGYAAFVEKREADFVKVQKNS